MMQHMQRHEFMNEFVWDANKEAFVKVPDTITHLDQLEAFLADDSIDHEILDEDLGEDVTCDDIFYAVDMDEEDEG